MIDFGLRIEDCGLSNSRPEGIGEGGWNLKSAIRNPQFRPRAL
jgi:hypothetical protein